MKILSILLVVTLLSCVTADMPSKYDAYEGCYICDVAKKHDVRLEDVGNAIRIGGLAARTMDAYTAEQAIKVVSKIRAILDMPLTWITLLDYVGDLQAEYVEVLTIAMSYAGDFAIPQVIDEQSVEILTKFLDERLVVLSKYVS